MNKKILFFTVMTCFITTLYAQSNKSTKAYAITATEKGQSSWKEIRLIDIKTGDAETIFSSGQQAEILNARTGKPVQPKDAIASKRETENNREQVYIIDANNKAQLVSNTEDVEKLRAGGNKVIIVSNSNDEQKQYSKPFGTNSAALAYDKKHERLYYTPMGINQLRYIDLKSKTPKVYYFEDEAFGSVQGTYDVPNQITRMVIGSDGNGYALANNAEHLLRFTTGKKPVITDLGSITDDASNRDFSIHRGVGGDMIADNAGNLYLITAFKNVWKINIETMTAVYKGGIKGLPDGYQTNGAVVEEGNKIAVCSGTSTQGYYHFDLNDLQAEKISTAGDVFNASDMANGNLISADKKKDNETPQELAQVKEDALQAAGKAIKQTETTEVGGDNGILVYPNPVTDGIVKLSFNNQSIGKYNVQLLDMAGKTISNQSIVINSKTQVQEIKLPSIMGKGNYLVKVVSEDNRQNIVTKLTVQ